MVRFGTPAFAARLPKHPSHTALRLNVDAVHIDDIPIDEIRQLPRVNITADFHCVTTWSVHGLRWSGFRWTDVLRSCVLPRLGQPSHFPFVEFSGADRAATCVFVDDLAAGVILADRLDEAPLPLAHGAPLRVVAPALYGYKNVKHLTAITFRERYRRGPAERQTLAHPRGRVAAEERGRVLPQIIWRHLYRSQIASTVARYQQVDEAAKLNTL